MKSERKDAIHALPGKSVVFLSSAHEIVSLEKIKNAIVVFFTKNYRSL